VQSYRLTYDKRSTHEGMVRGEVFFVDGSVLHVREFVDTELSVDRLTYVYQYTSPAAELIFRYDNTGHHRRLGLATYPDHMHLGDGNQVVESSAPDLSGVLEEILTLVTPTA